MLILILLMIFITCVIVSMKFLNIFTFYMLWFFFIFYPIVNYLQI